MRPSLFFALILAAPLTTQAQWQLQDAHTTADLRGIDSVGNGVAWASGTNGTVLRTEDSGFVWQLCATPPGAEHLDFRGVQAFDNNTAIVMSSGKGDLSRLYKTTDGCQTWKLLFTNPEKDGFWDAIAFTSKPHPRETEGVLLGDPVRDRFENYTVSLSSAKRSSHRPEARKDEAIFAASNSSVFFLGFDQPFWFVTGGQGGARVLKRVVHRAQDLIWDTYQGTPLPVGAQTESSGGFSIAFSTKRDARGGAEVSTGVGLVVGGDFTHPEQSTGTAAYTQNDGATWTAAQTPPHGYRSAVTYDKAHNTWITVGPNGTDISTDDGRNWRPLKPGASDPPDADQHWNALSLPFVVGPHGRIATLRPDALSAKP